MKVMDVVLVVVWREFESTNEENKSQAFNHSACRGQGHSAGPLPVRETILHAKPSLIKRPLA